ncbi:MAG: hypothetical protein H7Y13_08675 [Sphingobacteriaceae bacterium]|nr:hypothetical protein [Sphingobacteriaceae bacterium]
MIINANVEGPYVYETGKNKWNMVWDYYGGNQGRYGMAQSTNLINWTWLTEKKPPYYNEKVSFPQGVRHGSVIPITLKQFEQIRKAFPTK